MPELPEVETVRRTLAPALGGCVTKVWTSGKSLHLGREVDASALGDAARGAKLEAIERIGKYLILAFSGRDQVVLVHLGMSGRLWLQRAGAETDPHVHVRFFFEGRGGDIDRELRFRDPRRFGLVTTARRGFEREHPALSRLGVDPLVARAQGGGKSRLAQALVSGFRGRTIPLKAALLDQRTVAGIGNIYASEALFEARLDPALPAKALTTSGATRLARAIDDVLLRALENGGTSLRDFVAGDGTSGQNAEYLRVYDRGGAACPRARCKGTIERAVMQGRATYFCPRCQRRASTAETP